MSCNNLAAASMATNANIRLLYKHGNLHKLEKNNATTAVAKVGYFPWWKGVMTSPIRRPKFYLVAASANSISGRNVDMVNAKKVNGIYVKESPSTPPYLGTTNTRLMTESNDHVDEKPLHTHLLGRFVEDRLAYRQTFVIRSYEIGPDKTATMETWMNLLQEAALNHVRSSGLAGDGFGATREMSLRKLIWVVTRIHIQVQSYSSWGDVIEIDTWVDTSGKNGMRRDWIIRDYNTQQIITRATSTWVIMNRETRKLSKMPEQVRQELAPFCSNRMAIPTENNDVERIDKLTDETAESKRSGLEPRWSDMDANQHVNNVKYIGWLLESVPIHVLEHYNLTSMTLEYRRECRQSNVIESLTTTAENSNNNCVNRKADLEYTHLLRMQADMAEIVRARTEWQYKRQTQFV